MKTRATLAAVAAVIAAYAAPVRGELLPNGWTVTPAGTLTPLGTMPLHMALDRTGRWIAVTNAGYARLSVTIVNAATGGVADSKTLDGAFYGVVFSHDDQTVYASTAAKDGVERFAFDAATGTLRDLGPWQLAGAVWTAGLAISPDDATLYVAANLADELYAVDAKSGAIRWTAKTGAQPLAVALSPDGKRAYVSDWAGSAVSVVDTSTGSKVADIAVLAHPNALAVTPDGRTIYVACANGDDVDAIDTATGTALAIDVGMWPHAPEGTTPDGLALSPDARTLYVAEAGDDTVAALDVSGTPTLAGAIPVGWYVTDVATSADGAWLYALDGDGTGGHPNPLYQHGAVEAKEDDTYYIGTLMTGDLERIRTPDANALADGLAKARADAQFGRASVSAPARSKAVKHVIYVIKENRTYDEILGDDPRGNGDASLAIFGKRITPNIHRLADDFALLDDFEENSFVSADGHNWVNAAYATDYVEKLWPADYAGRDRPYDFEGSPVSMPSAGYLWDDALAHGRTVRDYGEFVKQGPLPSVGDVPSLDGHVDPRYRGWDLKYTDQARVDEWQREFAQFERDGDLPDLEIVYLPDDHTAAISPGYRTPYAMLASNDYAVGRLVDRVSHSRYWKNTVVFVVEDDSQAGPDHVSAQRAEALIAGGPVRRGVVDHTHYTQCSVLRTIEMLLGLSPMSQFDAGATPMTSLLGSKPDVRPWTASHPNVDIGQTNAARAPGAQASLRLDLREADASDAALFDKILYEYGATLRRSNRGAATRGR